MSLTIPRVSYTPRKRMIAVPVVALLCFLFLAAVSFVWLRTPVSADSINTTDFVTTWKTDNPGASCSSCITITTNGGGYDYDIDWDNDGTFDQLGLTTSVVHDFGTPGTYTIRIRGDYPQRGVDGIDAQKLLEVNQWGSIEWRSMNRAFSSATNLSIPATDAPDLTNVTDMSGMFLSAQSFNDDISHWNTSNVTSMSAMFKEASAFNQDISSWDTGSVTDMSEMFYNALSFDQNLSDFDMSNVTTATWMFSGANMSRANYDGTLMGFSEQNLQNSVRLDAGTVTYCLSKEARQLIIDTHSWSIDDGGNDCGLRINDIARSDFAGIITYAEASSGSQVGVLTVDDITVRDDQPFELGCTTPGDDDDLFTIQGDILSTATDLEYLTEYIICIKATAQDGLVMETVVYLVMLELSPPGVITGVDFTVEDGKKKLVVTGDNMFGTGDGDIITGYTTTSFVRLNTLDLGFCAEGFGYPAETISMAFGIDSALVSDDPPCYELAGESGSVIVMTGSLVKVWLPPDFDTEATGTVSVNGSNTYTFNAVAPPDEDDDESEEPNPDGGEDDTSAPQEKPESSGSPATSSGTGRRTSSVAVVHQNAPDADEEKTQEVAPTVYVNGNKPIGQTPTIPKRPTFSGTATPGAEVLVIVGTNSRCSAKVDESGNWHCTLATDLEPGMYTIKTTVTHPDGSVVELDPFTATVLGVSAATPEVGDDTPKGGISLWVIIGAAVVAALALAFGIVRHRKSA